MISLHITGSAANGQQHYQQPAAAQQQYQQQYQQQPRLCMHHVPGLGQVLGFGFGFSFREDLY